MPLQITKHPRYDEKHTSQKSHPSTGRPIRSRRHRQIAPPFSRPLPPPLANSFLSLLPPTQNSESHTSTHRSTHGRINAHPRSPAVAKMKTKTTASSFRESRSTTVIKHISPLPRSPPPPSPQNKHQSPPRKILLYRPHRPPSPPFHPKEPQKEPKKFAGHNSRKHVAATSFSVAPLQIGRLYPRQNCRLQSLQFPARYCFRSSSAPSALRRGFGSSAEVRAREGGSVRARRPFAAAGEDGPASRAMMVLLSKQVHLQKEVGALEGRN
jgi:hypothetical protein